MPMLALWRARASTMALPMPVFPPVTIATLPSRVMARRYGPERRARTPEPSEDRGSARVVECGKPPKQESRAMATNDAYPPIEEHGLIGDLQTCALVNTNGTIDWFCTPRFDSPSVFASLLDHHKGGRFRIDAASDCKTRQLYFPDTPVLITR